MLLLCNAVKSWVDTASDVAQVLMSHAAKLRQSLDASPGLTPANIEEVRGRPLVYFAPARQAPET